MKHHLILLVIVIVILSGCTSADKSEITGKASKPQSTSKCEGQFEGTVEKIFDGDTIKLRECDKSIRLSLVDTPEDTEPGYQEAKSFTESLCKVGTIATIDQDDLQPRDRYDRTVGLVYCQNKKLNAELVSNNLGKIDTRFCLESEFSNEEWASDCQAGVTKDTCDSSYPSVCIPPSPPDLDCSDIRYRNFEVLQPDPHRFDGDKDGIGCEITNTTN